MAGSTSPNAILLMVLLGQEQRETRSTPGRIDGLNRPQCHVVSQD